MSAFLHVLAKLISKNQQLVSPSESRDKNKSEEEYFLNKLLTFLDATLLSVLSLDIGF